MPSFVSREDEIHRDGDSRVGGGPRGVRPKPRCIRVDEFLLYGDPTAGFQAGLLD